MLARTPERIACAASSGIADATVAGPVPSRRSGRLSTPFSPWPSSWSARNRTLSWSPR